MWDYLIPVVVFFGVIGLILFLEGFKSKPCPHTKTRCIHGDEIFYHMKVYVFRWWKPDIVRRQICLKCGKALDRTAICTETRAELHEWEGFWPYADRR